MAGEPDAANAGSDEVGEAWPLIADFLEDRATPEGLARLEELVATVPAVTRVFVRAAHLWCELPVHLGYARTVRTLLGVEETDAVEPDAMSETMIVRAVRDPGLGPQVADGTVGQSTDEATTAADGRLAGPRSAAVAPVPPMPPGRSPADAASTGVPRAWGRAWRPAAAVALIIGAGLLAMSLRGGRPPATITAVAGSPGGGSDGLVPGVVVAAGQVVRATCGAVEIGFRGGAVVVIEAPAQIRIDDADRFTLEAGSVVVHAPHRPAGFRVDAPGLTVVDQGTDFGVRTMDQTTVTAAVTPAAVSASEVMVFSGAVDVTPLDARGNAVSPPVRVTVGHGVIHGPAFTAGPPDDLSYSEASFVHNVRDLRFSLVAPGTGVGVAPGGEDPAWQVVAVPDDPHRKPQPARVMQHMPDQYTPNTPDGQWISVSGDRTYEAAGDVVFRTRVDLTGFDPATVVATASAASDDGIVDVRVNGISTGLTTPLKAPDGPALRYPLSLAAVPWKAGVNVVDVVVRNLPSLTPGNYVGLNLAWSLTASPQVKR